MILTGALVGIMVSLFFQLSEMKNSRDYYKESYLNLFDRTKGYLNPSEIADWEPEDDN